MARLPIAKTSEVLRCLCEGNSIASVTRITGVAKNTILSLLERAGMACKAYMDEHLVHLPCQNVELDEIWSFVGYKTKGTTNGEKLHNDPKEGDIWTWKAVCADTKLLICFHVGGRTFNNAVHFCRNMAKRFDTPPQISTDGLKSYQLALGYAFGSQDVNYGRIVKEYTKTKWGREVCTGVKRERVFGNPDMDKICTSHVERSNLTLRMSNRRFARRTNAFSKKIENHSHMLAIYAFNYNFCRKVQSLKVTPAQQAGIADHVWKLDEMVEMINGHHLKAEEDAFEELFERVGDGWKK